MVINLLRKSHAAVKFTLFRIVCAYAADQEEGFDLKFGYGGLQSSHDYVISLQFVKLGQSRAVPTY